MTVVLAGPVLAEPVQEALQARLESLSENGTLPVVATFYSQREYRPAWTGTEGARAVLAAVEGLSSHGLEPADLPLAELRLAAAEEEPGPRRQAEREVLLTSTLARLVAQLGSGKVDPRLLYPEWNYAPPPGLRDAVATLEQVVAEPDLGQAVEALAPRSPEYAALRRALADYRKREERGGWESLPAGPSLKPGMRDARVPALRARLAAEREATAAAPGPPTVFDSALSAALARFQARHGLQPDGVLGARTLAELNVPLATRIDQIRVNLERLRWVARDQVGDHLRVDIAGYSARLQVDGQVAWDSKVVVGRPTRRTPVFRADMEHLVLNPAWVVPPTILREDVLPKVARDPGYLAAHDMRMVSLGQGRGAPYQIVQAPGPKNPLGQLKFMLPNPYTIYLHDTPARRLFQRAERAESSGCVRLEKPLELAVLLLNDPERWSREALQAELAKGRTRTVYVRRQVPVLLLYYTAEVEGGEVRFRPDVYRKDGAVLAELKRGRQS
jgi:murein L,D-transpeptidase YcbB/YkuD